MISRQHRFHGHNALRYVYQQGRTVRGPWLTLKWALNDRRRHYRAAVVVSKKVSKSAVTRNRIRRRVYERLRAHQTLITRPYDIVITVFHEQVAAWPSDELDTALRGQLASAGIISPPSLPAKRTGTHAIVDTNKEKT